MALINRREYLARMVVGTAGLVAAGTNELNRPSSVLGRTVDGSEARTAAHAAGSVFKQDWNWTEVPPGDNPGIRLIFVGMMVFTYKGKDAEVIFHRGAHQHNLRIEIHEVGPICRQVFRLGGGAKPLDIEEMKIQVEGAPNNAMFFRRDDQPLDRKNGHLRDFRWLLDLEGPLMYDHKLERKDDVFTTKLRIRQGTFFTYQRTINDFVLKRGAETKEVNHVAKIMAADIPLPTGRAIFTIDGTEIPYPLTGPSKFEIYFFNECECVDPDCSNCAGDFNMIFDAVTLASTTDEYRLEVVQPPKQDTQTEGLCQKIPEKIYKKRNTDEAPCMGGGFGGGGGFP